MRRIVLLLGGTESDRKAATAAVALARRLDAQVEGIYIKIDPSEVMARMGAGMAAAGVGDVFRATLEAADAAAVKAKATLESAARKGGLAINEAPANRPGPGAFFSSIQGPSFNVLDSRVGLADLVVFGEPDEAGPFGLISMIEHTLLTLRRPILIARGELAADFADKVLIAFKGSHECATALMRAAPILKAAKSTEVVHLREKGLAENPGEQAMRYLGQHSVRAKATEIEPGTGDIGEEIARYARSMGASLIVMGGYGRSRMREFILGGATRHLIRRSPVPVFLAH